MPEKPSVHLRTPDELTPAEHAQFERAMDSGITELPPNQPKGMLGEKGIDVRKVEDYTPDLNAGILQENDPNVKWLVIVLSYLLFFPIAYVLLWRSKYISPRAKWIASGVGAAGIVFVLLRVSGS
jgi:hypothetical protein